MILPEDEPGHVWHIFSVLTAEREKLKAFLTAAGVGVIIHYPKPIYRQLAYQNSLLNETNFQNTNKICNEVLSLPMGPHLEVEEALFCVQTIKTFFK